MISLEHLSKTYKMGDIEVHALQSVDLTVEKGEFVAIMGMSGSGKSTLMNIIGCLDLPSSGSYNFLSRRVDTCTRKELAELRNSQIGFVFQNFSLLSRTTALENVELPMLYNRDKKAGSLPALAKAALEKVGLGERMHHLPNQLSGGQQQRVAIARALVNDPPLILADEPTGALDTRTSEEVMELFTSLHKSGKTIILVTHEMEIAQYARRLITMRDGCILSDEPVGKK
ncbi:MAG: ABC transporter ATP-binding protein [Chitinispirillaceae bacterium]|nr:ABC transporter ATP-binding protein [Chitinispirillaceae bacterium]